MPTSLETTPNETGKTWVPVEEGLIDYPLTNNRDREAMRKKKLLVLFKIVKGGGELWKKNMIS